jgi:hypothetical protein
LDVNLGSETFDDISAEDCLVDQPRLKKKQSWAGECADCNTRAGVTELALAGFWAAPAAAAATAIAAAAVLAMGRECRTMTMSPLSQFTTASGASACNDLATRPIHWLSAAPEGSRPAADRRSSDEPPPGAQVAAARSRRVWSSGRVGCRMAVPFWSPAARREGHDAMRVRVPQCSFCASASAPMRRAVGHDGRHARVHGAFDAKRRVTTRSALGAYQANAQRPPAVPEACQAAAR